jgi:hypothetical protein
MTTVAARPPRPIPTVQASPALLREGDMIYPDGPWRDVTAQVGPLRVTGCRPVVTNDGDRGWLLDLQDHLVYLIPSGDKVRTQRRSNDDPPIAPEVADQIADSYREARYE